MSRKRFLVLLAVVCAVGFGVRLGHLMIDVRGQPAAGDAAFYHRTANLIASGKGYIDPFRYDDGFRGTFERTNADGTSETVAVTYPPGIEQATASHPPAWPYLLSVASWLGLRSESEHRAIGVLIGTLGVALVGLAGRELFGDRVGLVSAGIASVYGFLWLNDAALMSEPLVTVLVPLTTIVAVRWWRSPGWRGALLLGLLAGVGGLVRSELLAYGPLLVLGAVLLGRRARRPLIRDLAVTLGVAALVLAPWVVRNLTAFEEPILLSPTGTMLAQTNCDATYFGPKLGYWELECGQPEPTGPNGELLDESQRDTIRRTAARAYADEHLGRLVTVAAPLRVLRMFNVYDPVQTARFDIVVESRDFRQSIFALVQYYLVAVAAVIGVVVARRRHLPLFVVLLWPGLVALVATVGFGNNRYRVSAEPSFIWLASLALVAAWVHLRARKEPTASVSTKSTAGSESSPLRAPVDQGGSQAPGGSS
jgi:4-amino-4-deoxy-L-arabinose transferase-like glycosyltransferase